MLRKASEAVPESNGPVPQKEGFGSGQLMWGDAYRMMEVAFDRWDKNLDEISDKMRKMDEHVTRLEHSARQPRVAMEADGSSNTKTQERTEVAAKAVQAVRRDSCTAEQMVQDGPQTSITFGGEAEPPDVPCWEDVLVEEGATSPESCLSILGDALTNSRRWLSSHRRSLHSHRDHLQRATSSVLRDRGDESRGGLEDGKFMDFNSIRLVRQQQLLETACCSILPESR